MLKHDTYHLKDPDALETPVMLVFEYEVDYNIQTLCDLCGGGRNLMPHVKTHKSIDVNRKQIAAGMAGFKCATLKELEMVLEAGAKNVIMAYPLIQPIKARRFARLCRDYPSARVSAIAGEPDHIELLARIAESDSQNLNIMLDADVGFHRTGVYLNEAAGELYRSANDHPALTVTGLHVYDGHDHFTDLKEREQAALAHVQEMKDLREQLEKEGLPVERVVGGGSFSFPYFAREEGMFGSPGTTVYWDYGYTTMTPDMPFHWATLVLIQVVDKHPEQGTVTTDLGNKAVAGDPPNLEIRAKLLGYDDAKLVQQSEEHGVFKINGELPAVGTYLFAVPGHVCPTTVHYPGSHVVNEAGSITGWWEHTARDRL